MNAIVMAALLFVSQTEESEGAALSATEASAGAAADTTAGSASDGAADVGEDGDALDHDRFEPAPMPEATHHQSYQKHNERHRLHQDDVVRGLYLTLLAGGDLRARDDIGRLGRQLGPAADPTRFGTTFTIQGAVQLTRYARIGADLSTAGFAANGRGADRGGIEIRQTMDYRFWAAGLLGELVWPVTNRVELSIGTVLGAAQLNIEGRATRITEYSQLGVDLRAIPKAETTRLNAAALYAKPGIGARVVLSKNFALEARAGVQLFYVFRNSLAVLGDFPLNRSPEMTEVLPFIQVGVSVGSWKWKKVKP